VAVEYSPELIADLRDWWFGSVHEIADLEYRRQTWLNPPTPSPHWSYVEFRACFPKADQLDDARRRGFLSEKEHAIMMGVCNALSSQSYKPPGGKQYDHEAILADPAWHAVVAKADAARRRLLELITDPRERRSLLGE
jgi:hypothetical protein